MSTEEQIEDVLIILRAQVEKLASLDLKLAASFIRIAERELEVQLRRIGIHEADVLGFCRQYRRAETVRSERASVAPTGNFKPRLVQNSEDTMFVSR